MEDFNLVICQMSAAKLLLLSDLKDDFEVTHEYKTQRAKLLLLIAQQAVSAGLLLDINRSSD